MTMLPSFEIKNFRTFDHLVIDKLAQINLITGENGVGKTTLLEAISLFLSRGSLAFLKEVTHLNNQDEIIKHMYNSHYFKNNQSSSDNTEIQLIIFGGNGNKIFFEIIEDFNNPYGKLRIETTGDKTETTKCETRNICEEIQNPKKNIEELSNCYFIDPFGISRTSTEDKWNKVIMNDSDNYLLEGLRLINNNIEKISPIINTINGNTKLDFVVKLKSFDKFFSLKSLGEGTYKLFQILLTIINIKDGTLLIDEIENGLHYSVQPKMWDLIFTLAKRLNVQVFATTHSWDCIEAFQKASSQHQDVDCELIRLSKVKDQFRATIFEKNELETVTQERIEVR